jgi:acetylornithine/N-succinyldiaminopimelate aminotransferase
MTNTVHKDVDVAVDATISRRNRYLTANYPRVGITVVEGSGCEFVDSTGRRYLDLFSGFGGTILGHCHPELVAAATEQAGKLWHVGNHLDTEPQTLLAEAIATHGFGGLSCFGHSGSDANEAAFKLVRLYGRRDGGDRYKVIATERGFHGRGFAAMNATSGEKARKGYDPFLDGFSHVPYNDLAAMEAAIDDRTAAIIVEPIQGEGGVYVPDDDYLPGLRALCDRHDLLLIVDEVWTGCGRTGEWFAYQHSGIAPDIMTLGKAVGCGLPVSVMCASERIAGLFSVESYGATPHASTLAGSCIPMAVSARMFEIVERDGLVKRAARLGDQVMTALRDRAGRLPIKEVRGRGLFIGVEFEDGYPRTAADVVGEALDRGFLLGSAGARVLRFAPPIIVSESELERGVELIADLLTS